MPRSGKDRRPLMLKFRIVPRVRMRRSDIIRHLRRAVRTGIIPDEIDIRYLDWEKGNAHGGGGSSGRITGAALEELRVFYDALTAADIRVERAD